VSKLNVKYKKNETESIQIITKPLLPKQIIQLKEEWLALESKSSPLFFLSWRWIGPWLTQVSTTEKLMLVQATHHAQTVGLCIFVEKKTTRHSLVNSTQWLLHRSGVDNDDQIWIENNNFLVTDKNKELIIQAIWKTLQIHHHYVDEFIVAMHHNRPEKLKLSIALEYKIKARYIENGYYVNLKNISTIDDYLLSLSKNTRKQINRSFKLLSQIGNIEFSVIQCPEQQTEVLEQCKQWHIDKWKETNTPSGFINSKFTDFHQNLINEDHATSKAVVASLKVNEELTGCLYCFIDNQCAYFYLSAFKPIKDNRIKLGLTLHTLFIKSLIETSPNITKYDFLAGEARYKKSLANNQDMHCYLVIQKNSLKFRIENLLTLMKERLINW
jgi:hypothetical protein